MAEEGVMAGLDYYDRRHRINNSRISVRDSIDQPDKCADAH